MRPSLPAGSPPTPERFPTLGEVLGYFGGVMDLMVGRREGLRRLDLTADGFWRSFNAILVAAPPTVLSWIEFEHVEREEAREGFAIYGAHALADLSAWVLPILVLMLLARPARLSRHVAPLVISLNWGGALLAWALLPLWLLLLLFGGGSAMAAIAVVVLVVAIVLTARMLATAMGADMLIGGVAVVLLLLCSFVAYGAVSDLLGIPLS